jgi:hypothetical protein
MKRCGGLCFQVGFEASDFIEPASKALRVTENCI